MMTFFQKIFLSKSKRAIFDVIEQNANKIDYDYTQKDAYMRHTFTISTPTIELRSVFELPAGKTSYQFVQYKPDGQILRSKEETSTFSTNIHSEMFCKFVETHGVRELYKKRVQHIKQ